ncbi:MAG: dihydroorotate dehydrogenase-like protein [Candidatus Promineifilaceae bacterium]
MANLSTTYLGIKLKNPLVVSSSPASENIDNIKRMEASGASAVILYSLFEEQIELQNLGYHQFGPEYKTILPDELQHIPDMAEYNHGANNYLAHIYQAKKAVDIPIIASLNGYYPGGWVQYAKLIEAAGADALELNVYYLSSKPDITGKEIEQMHIDLVKSIKEQTTIPVAIKLSPFFSAFANMAQQLDNTGVDGMVLFNRFYQPDFDVESRVVIPSLTLSERSELRLRLRWAAILYNRIKADIAITGGVHTVEDVVKSVLAGAKTVMLASVLLRHGIEYLQELESGLHAWLDAHEYESLAELCGKLSQTAVKDPVAFERANYMRVLKTYKT